MTAAVALAALVGVSLLLLVALMQLGGLLAAPLLRLAAESREEAPAWLTGLVNLLLAGLTFLAPFFFLYRAAGSLGYSLPTGRGRLPVAVLLPLFLGVMITVNSLSSVLLLAVTSLLGLPAAAAQALPDGFAGRLFYFLAVCAATPFCEEMLFRGAIQRMLRVWGPRGAIFVTSVLFTLLHPHVREWPAVFALSLLLGYVAEVSGSVQPCVILHFANNLAAFAMLWVRSEMPAAAAFAMIVWMILILAALFAGAVWMVRRFRLGAKLRLPADAPQEKGKSAGMAGLFRTPAFAAGALAVLAQCVWRLSAAGG